MMAKWRWKWWQIVALVLIAWITFFSVDFEYDRKRPLAGGLTMVERVHVTRTPYVGMAESGGSFFLPIPYQTSDVESWRVMRGDSVVWQPEPGELEMQLSFSPDGKHLLVWDQVALNPWHVHEVAGPGEATVAPMRSATSQPSVSGMPDGLFRVLGWSSDSRRVYAALEGVDLKPPMRDGMLQPYPYREVWAIDAAIGATTRLQRCEKPEPGTFPSWDGTPCADDAPRS